MQRLITLVLGAALLLAACGDGAGSAGPVTTLPPVGGPVVGTGTPTTADTVPGSVTTTPPSTVPATTDGSTTTVPPITTATLPPFTTTTTVPVTSTEPPGPPRPTKVYFLLDSDDEFRPGPLLVPVHREIPGTLAVATNTMRELIAGPTAAERAGVPALSSAVPDDSRLLGIDVADGLATIDLSVEFERGSGSFSESARIAQVVYTLTQFPTVDRVAFRIGGEPITFFGGHGIEVDPPVGRDPYEWLLPFIFVDGPSYDGAAGNPLRVTGLASVFEATFEYVLTDNEGLIISEGFVTGGSGLGFGPFDFTIQYDVDTPQLGALIVFETSAESGAMINVREHPVLLSPAS